MEPRRDIDFPAQASDAWDRHLDRLIGKLPPRLRKALRWLRKPSSRWLRLPAGLLLICGSLLAILPVFGLWMLPLGLALLAEDVKPLRRPLVRLLGWGERVWRRVGGE